MKFRGQSLSAIFSLILTTYSIYGSACIQSDRKGSGTPSLLFIDGEDTATCGGIISAEGTKVTFTKIRLCVGCPRVITQLVNVTNEDSSDHSLEVSVVFEDFGEELSFLRLHLVSPNYAQSIVVELDGSGEITTERVAVTIPRGEEWSIKLTGSYNPDTLISQVNSFVLCFQII